MRGEVVLATSGDASGVNKSWLRRRARGIAFCALVLGASPATAAEEGLTETAARYFCTYKSNYFILGITEQGRTNPTTKFQFSFQAMLLDLSKRDATILDTCAEPAGRHLVHFGYSQKSLWNLYADSAPFEENNYNPEIFYAYNVQRFGISWASLGIEHESNGESGDDSRSWNRLYGQARWNLQIGKKRLALLPEWPADQDHWYAAVEAKFWWPFESDDGDGDLDKYIGYGKLRGVLNSREYAWGAVAFDVEATKGGNPIQFDYGSVQLGASYRQPRFGRVKFVPFFYVQYFEGYGETLIRASDHTRALRAGIRLIL